MTSILYGARRAHRHRRQSIRPEGGEITVVVVFSPHLPEDERESVPSPSDTFLAQLPLIEQIIRCVCRGRRMDRDETEEFAAFARLRLIDKDYAVIRKFKGRSSFGTFMTAVISRLLNAYRDHEWGRWRHSAEARRLGPLAVDLERLMTRDSRSLDEALGELTAKYPGLTLRALEQMAMRLPARQRRRLISIEESGEPEAAQRPAEIDKTETVALISSAVSSFIDRLPQEDQLIFQLRFEHDMPVPQIAHSLRQDMQSLYRRLRKHFGDLRVMLEKKGITATDVATLTGPDRALLDFHLKTADRRPSNEDEHPPGLREESA